MALAGCLLARSGTFGSDQSGVGGDSILRETTTTSAGGAGGGLGGAAGDDTTTSGPIMNGTGGANTGGASGMNDGGGGATTSTGAGGAGGVPTVVWNSWDVTTDTGSTEVVGGVHTASIELYQSVSLTDFSVDAAFEQYHSASHPEAFNNVESYWALLGSSALTYPYGGKSTVARGDGVNESATPQPLAVFDLQLHPPDTDKLVVMAFVAPIAGDYTATNIAVRRVDDRGDTARLVLHSPCGGSSLVSLQATDDQAWVVSPIPYALGSMNVGDRICVGVSRDGNFFWDAVEVAWTLTAQP